MDHISLTLFVLLPLLFSLILGGPWFPNNEVKIRRTAKSFAVIQFLYSLCFLAFSNSDVSGYTYKEELLFFNKISWVKSLGCNFALGLDGISLILIILTSFIFLLAAIASKSNINKRHKLYYSLFFVLQTAVLGVFCAKDLLLFFIFWEIELIPMYLLIALWGGGRKEYSAMKFLLYTFSGSIFMLASIIAVYVYNYMNTGVLTFDMEVLSAVKTYSYPYFLQLLIFAGFFIGFAVKLPIVPLHTWLPDAHVDAPTPISMILAGILLKMGGYGLIRINLQILPDIFRHFAPLLIVLGVVNIIYAAMIAFAQTDMKKLIAYSSISHMGIVLLGLGALNTIGITGAVFQMVAHGIISAGLFMFVGVIYLRTHTREIAKLSGIGQLVPRTMYLSLIITLASIGLPLLVGFAAEILVFYGAFLSESCAFIKPATYIAMLGIILSAGYLLWMFKRVFYNNTLPELKTLKDITPHELFVLISIAFVIITFGLCPSAIVTIFEPTVYNILKIV